VRGRDIHGFLTIVAAPLLPGRDAILELSDCFRLAEPVAVRELNTCKRSVSNEPTHPACAFKWVGPQ
jgi:hypothetical protein